MSKAGDKTSGGVELTDELIERLADEAERGYDVERLRPRRRRGRPGNPEMRKIPESAWGWIVPLILLLWIVVAVLTGCWPTKDLR